VFLYSWNLDSVDLLSREAMEKPNRTPHGLSLCGPFCVSGNGRYVAFSTADTNIYPVGSSNLFRFAVWDTIENRNVVAVMTNISQDGGGPVTNYSNTGLGAFPPTISENGSVLVYGVQSALYFIGTT